MAGETVGKSEVQQRRFARMPLAGTVHYICAPNDGGVGTWQDVGRGGACVKLHRYLRPGRHVILSVKPGFDHGAYAELKGRVAWSRRCGESGSFVTGLRIFEDAPEAGHTLSELIHEALGQAGLNDRTDARAGWFKRMFTRETERDARPAASSNAFRPYNRSAGEGLNLTPLSGIL